VVKVPSRSKPGEYHLFKALARCHGGNLYTVSGIQINRCPFIAVSTGAKVNPAALFEAVARDCARIIANRHKIFDAYEVLASAAVVDAFETRTIESAESILKADQKSTYFFLRNAWPEVLGNRCVLLIVEVDGAPHWQLYIPASPSGFRATLDSECVHVLASSSHVQHLAWDIAGMATLREVLVFLGGVYRFSDVGFHQCLNVEDTLASRLPVVLPFLLGAELLINGLDGRPARQEARDVNDITNGAAPRREEVPCSDEDFESQITGNADGWPVYGSPSSVAILTVVVQNSSSLFDLEAPCRSEGARIADQLDGVHQALFKHFQNTIIN
jgi:hypothetical protein